MNLVSKLVIKNLFKKYHFLPSKRLGQNFLVDKSVLKKIFEPARLSENDIVLEIGPGIGNLTQELAKKVKKVIAIEKDPRMVEILKETLKDFNNIKIIQADILKIENWKLIKNWKLKNENYKVIANLPYYITAPVLRKFLEIEKKPKLMVFLVQKEVAQKICAKVPKMNLLALSVQFYAQPKIIGYLSKKSFWPQPKVDSAILQIRKIQRKRKIDSERFFKIVKAGFRQPRKQILNNLSKMLKLDKEKLKSWLLKNNIQPSQRGETLKIKDWIHLSQSLPS
jgi:16S rRNA (adenine1518-N6/adenine1519-N6)-dimethyltransferase